MTGVNAIEMQAVNKAFGAVQALDNVSFKVESGSIHALLGENGAGKSSLMSVLFGLYKPDSGTIKINGQEVQLRSPNHAAAHGIGMVHQNFRLVPTLTATENIILGETKSLWRGRQWRKQKEQEINALAESFGLRFPVGRYVWQLSAGEQQRVEIVKTLYRKSDIIILDEPTSVLTPHEADDLYDTLVQLKTAGKTVVVTTHKLKEVMQVCDRISVMRKGKMIDTLQTSETNINALSTLVMGSEQPPRVEVQKSLPGKILLDVQHIYARGNHGEQALKDVHFHVRQGEILGIAGVAGNGQTELAEVITGMRQIEKGTLVFDNKKVLHPSVAEMIRLGVAHVPENRMLTGMAGNLGMTDNLLMKTYKKTQHSQHGFMKDKQNQIWAKNVQQQYDIVSASVNTPVRNLSGGNQQKIVLAREIEGEPQLLVAVHPTQGLDVGAAASVAQLLMNLRNSQGAVLLISEDLDEVLQLSDRVIVLYEGSINGEFIPAQISRQNIGLYMTGSNDQALEVS